MTSQLSVAADIVWEAFNQDEPGIFVDYGDCLAAALEAAAQHIQATSPWTGHPESPGVSWCINELQAIAAELKG